MGCQYEHGQLLEQLLAPGCGYQRKPTLSTSCGSRTLANRRIRKLSATRTTTQRSIDALLSVDARKTQESWHWLALRFLAEPRAKHRIRTSKPRLIYLIAVICEEKPTFPSSSLQEVRNSRRSLQ